MSSILSTQNRHSFLRRKNCFLPATALSPPVGRMDPLTGLPPLCSAIVFLLMLTGRYSLGPSGGAVAGAAVGVGAAGAGCGGAGTACPGAAGAGRCCGVPGPG